MQIGMIGLGRMGANMVRRLTNGGHLCVVYDRPGEAVRVVGGNPATVERFGPIFKTLAPGARHHSETSHART